MNMFKNLAVMALVIGFVACGDDSGTSSTGSPTEPSESSSSKAGPDSHQGDESSSSASQYVCDIYTLRDAVNCTCDEDRKGKLAYNHDSNVELVCILDEYLNKWGWVTKKDEESSSSVGGVSSSSVASSSSSVNVIPGSSSSVIPGSDRESSSSTNVTPSSSQNQQASSSSVKVSSSSDDDVLIDSLLCTPGYPYCNRPLYGDSVNSKAYKKFVDPRNGRSYFYLTINGRDEDYNHVSVTVMAENLNIGEMVSGKKYQSDDSKIERYCYNDDTTKCERYGGLYQWAEMMQLPSECNEISCADRIKPNHQGICPDGWRLLTYDDYNVIVHADGNRHGVEDTRGLGFDGYNYSGYSLIGAGYWENGAFNRIDQSAFWAYPTESTDERSNGAYTSRSSNDLVLRSFWLSKKGGYSVRCVMVE